MGTIYTVAQKGPESPMPYREAKKNLEYFDLCARTTMHYAREERLLPVAYKSLLDKVSDVSKILNGTYKGKQFISLVSSEKSRSQELTDRAMHGPWVYGPQPYLGLSYPSNADQGKLGKGPGHKKGYKGHKNGYVSVWANRESQLDGLVHSLTKDLQHAVSRKRNSLTYEDAAAILETVREKLDIRFYHNARVKKEQRGTYFARTRQLLDKFIDSYRSLAQTPIGDETENQSYQTLTVRPTPSRISTKINQLSQKQAEAQKQPSDIILLPERAPELSPPSSRPEVTSRPEPRIPPTPAASAAVNNIAPPASTPIHTAALPSDTAGAGDPTPEDTDDRIRMPTGDGPSLVDQILYAAPQSRQVEPNTPPLEQIIGEPAAGPLNRSPIGMQQSTDGSLYVPLQISEEVDGKMVTSVSNFFVGKGYSPSDLPVYEPPAPPSFMKRYGLRAAVAAIAIGTAVAGFAGAFRFVNNTAAGIEKAAGKVSNTLR